ncbi:hypothetical protein JCM19294_1613 [Nonlabens tegetincola]|uniref:Uncharacterized protein n=1 Tax=Nonlabens tegetincola TaxID=323273 RepID=A0A090QRC1_9FLAO|nr:MULTISPECIES: hypothetical protein [Nonlabens]ARN70316.1 hypothetical protein BST91_00920 [Nonlabens tegetincola]GAK97991.1 hypothetical protein JCM19294_1613 [Nonlabens tegetincola]
MRTGLLWISFITYLLCTAAGFAQEKTNTVDNWKYQDSLSNDKQYPKYYQKKIDDLNSLHQLYESELRTELKEYVEKVNKDLEKGKISADKAQELKRERAAQVAALITSHKKRIEAEKDFVVTEAEKGGSLSISTKGVEISLNGENLQREKKKFIKTQRGFSLSLGYNFLNGDNLGINDFSYPNNNYIAFGPSWLTQLDEKNHIRIRYGIEYQSHGLELNGNRIFTPNTDDTMVAPIGFSVEKAKFRQDQLMVPVHFEFGGTEKREYEDGRVRFTSDNSWKVGIGGFAGLNLSSRLKLKYEENGRDIKQTTINAFENNVFFYGLDAYIGKGNISFFGRMNLNDVFKSGSVDGQYVSFGIRFI